MFHHQYNTFYLLLVAAVAIAEIETPLGVKTCADNQPNVVECRREALQEAVPLLASGLPQLGAEPIDPLTQLPTLLWQSNFRGVALKFRLDNSRFTGLGRSIVDNLQVDTKNNRIRIVSHVDGAATLEGTYTMVGKVLSVPMDGSGFFKLTMNGWVCDVTYSGHPVNGEGGHTYLKIDSVSVKLASGESQYELTGIFGDYQPLVHAGNMFINSVTANIVEPEMLPTLEKWLADIYLQRSQAVFSTVPYDELFPKTSAYRGFYRAVFPHYL